MSYPPRLPPSPAHRPRKHGQPTRRRRNRRTVLYILLPLAAFIVIGGIAGSHNKTATGTTRNPPDASSTATATSGTTAATASPRPSPTPRAAPAVVTGFGAATAAWNAHHVADHDFAAGSVYNPDPSLPDINGHTGAVYVEVSTQDGRVLSYAMNLPAGTTLHAATRTALAEFPRGTRLRWIAHKGTCVQAQFASNSLGRYLGRPAIGDASGKVLVEFEHLTASGLDTASPRTFNSASFDLGGTPTPAGSPGC